MDALAGLAIVVAVIAFLLIRDRKEKRGFWYGERYKPEAVTEPQTYLTDYVRNSWKLVLDYHAFQAYWDGEECGQISIYEKPELCLYEEFETDVTSQAEAEQFAVDWFDNRFGYPFVALDEDGVIAVWEGKTELIFKLKDSQRVLWVWKDYVAEMPSTREEASQIAWEEWQKLKEDDDFEEMMERERGLQ